MPDHQTKNLTNAKIERPSLLKPTWEQYPWWCKSSPMTITTPPPPSQQHQLQQQQQQQQLQLQQPGGSASSTGVAGTSGGGQGVLLCPRTLSQARRSRLRRALTEATAETVNYVKAVGHSILLWTVLLSQLRWSLTYTHAYLYHIGFL